MEWLELDVEMLTQEKAQEKYEDYWDDFEELFVNGIPERILYHTDGILIAIKIEEQ